MNFKNYRRDVIRAADEFGNCIIFKSGEERELPEHLEEMACAAGLVPLDDVVMQEELEAQQATELAAAERAKVLAEHQAEAERIAALEEAADKAKRSEAAKKAAAKRKVN